MKIGIVTFSLSDNAGAMLQLYSLYTFLKKQGYDTEVVKYSNKLTYEKQYPLYIFKKNKRYLKQLFLKLPFIIQNHYKFVRFRKRIRYSKKINRGKIKRKLNYDVVIFGSDQILHLPFTNFDKNFLNGEDIINSSRKVMFSGSIGSYSPNNNEEWIFMQDALSNLTCVSFREKETCDLFKKNTNLQFINTCDPTMLLSVEEWKQNIKEKPKENFIFLYYATGELLKEAIEYSEKNNLLVYYAYPLTQMPTNDRFIKVNDDPVNFLTYIFYAHYVFTSSFHCLLFSLLFDKRCYCPINNSDKRYERLKSLISNIDCGEFLSKITDTKINYNFLSSCEELIEKSKEFLKKSIEN